MSEVRVIRAILENRDPLDEAKAFEIIRNARFSLNIPSPIKPAERKLIGLVIRRWTAAGYWLDFNLLGKGRSNEYPLNLPGVKAEEGWAKVLQALLELCVACHRYSRLKELYFWPNHLWLAVINDIVQQDINGALEGKASYKKATLEAKRNFIGCLKKEKMPSREDWGDAGSHSYQLFKTTVALSKLGRKSPSFIKARNSFISLYEDDTTAYDKNNRAKSVLVDAGVMKLQMSRHPQATGWRPLQLPKLPTEFWNAYSEDVLDV